jgi:hypothetical protein
LTDGRSRLNWRNAGYKRLGTGECCESFEKWLDNTFEKQTCESAGLKVVVAVRFGKGSGKKLGKTFEKRVENRV